MQGKSACQALHSWQTGLETMPVFHAKAAQRSRLNQGPFQSKAQGTSSSNPSLAELPLELLEAICSTLPLRDRVALASCCRALASHPGLALSAALWEVVEADVRGSRQHWHQLAPWLERRSPVLRSVRLAGLSQEEAAAVVQSLGGSRVTELALTCLAPAGGPGQAWKAAAAPVTWLQPLQHLAGLTSLDLSRCSLTTLPECLAALGMLRSLSLTGNSALGQGCGDGLQPLLGLTSLEQLSLRECGFRRLPRQLSALSTLRQLDASRNYALGWRGEEAFAPLASLTGLMHLQLGHCTLQALPAALGALRVLSVLCLDWNFSLGHPTAPQYPSPLRWCASLAQHVEECFQPLAQLTALTSLVLRECALGVLPPQLASLPHLADLDASFNFGSAYGQGWQESREAALQPLNAMPWLRRLDVSRCGLRALPGLAEKVKVVGLDCA